MQEIMQENKKPGMGIKAATLLLTAILVLTVFNSFQIMKLKSAGNTGVSAADVAGVTGAAATEAANTNVLLSNPKVIPKGIPELYGEELGVSFDDISTASPQKADATIKKLGLLENQITLAGEDLERYIDTLSQISCEYCCGADSIITADGKPACGCAHSAAMRGLTKYLIKNHGNEYSNDELLEEMGKWKTLFFPTQITRKAGVLESKGIELSYINLASNKYKGIEKDITGGAVGGC